ncbi:TetR/AcrR family transcriptional regulator [Paenibacillus sp. y28]|uniref:TetR/AcrR family transcriptional regulator n=1 Tax=Paenibacillus sp. y28 TaxID=3129110 RepID=UPI0030192F33
MMTDNRGNPSFQLLLETTERLIRQKGCRSTTMQDIMQETGLSKGAIYYYVKSKEELFGVLLHDKLVQMDARFMEAARQSKGLEDPLSIIAQGQRGGHHEGEVVNRVLIYLLGQKDKPGIAELLDRFHEAWLRTAAQWIEIGQRSGVIPADMPARKTAELFTLLSYGMRMRNMMAGDPEEVLFTDRDFLEFMRTTLQGERNG